MKKIWLNILDSIIFLAANILGFYLSLLGDKIFYFHVIFLGFIFRIFDKRRKWDLLNNLDFAYDNALDSKQKRDILISCYRHFSFVILNAIRLLFMKKERYIAKFEVENAELIEGLMKNGNFIFITAHFGDWEGTSRFVAHRYKNINLSVVGRFTQFDSVNNLMEKSRQKFGARFLDKRGVGRHLVKLLNDKKNIIGLVIDQNIAEYEGIWVKMFGKSVTHTSIASVLARKYKIPIVFAYLELNNDYSRYKLVFKLVCKPIISHDSKADILEMTQKQCDFTEQIIRKNNGQYFWFHKRFKAKYNEIYNKST